MPVFRADQLRRFGCTIFEAAGCAPDDARVVAEHLVESNLFGHDSHGMIRVCQYGQGIREGRFKTSGVPRIVRQAGATAVVDGNGMLGPIGATFAMRHAMSLAVNHGVGAVALRNTSHIGRVGAYPLIAAREGFIAQAHANAGRMGFEVAPFGGIDGKLTTNPLAFAAPRRHDDPIMLDMTTSVAAVGKVWVAQNKGQSLPEGWIIDHQGRPSTDPHDLTGEPRGAILPMGACVAHKGYGLGIMVEVLAGGLSRQGCAAGETQLISNGVLFVVYRLDAFADPDTYFDDVERMVAHVKSSRLARGHQRIYMPGEIEFEQAKRRRREGIEIDDNSWADICAEAKRHGVAEDQ